MIDLLIEFIDSFLTKETDEDNIFRENKSDIKDDASNNKSDTIFGLE